MKKKTNKKNKKARKMTFKFGHSIILLIVVTFWER